ncbi:c-type cytochrome [Sedimenticola selenatireducens]|uniref:Cytochrome C n=1 Tax=Sedimenticola selenatireducens TaxID=191960 RepID=A0A2N6CVS0_9GAMM|nr:c-type cytochrome [Sedimenticola selenatireducens]PLX61321.1 MAG: cytochrome C [Sedimenticola selenatireducens]
MNKIKLLAVSLIAVTSLMVGATAVAADGAALYKAKTCWSCHGKDAKTPLMPFYPSLAGQNADYMFNQMKDIKSGARSNGQTAAMKGVMGLVNEEEMRVLADWLATQQ